MKDSQGEIILEERAPTRAPWNTGSEELRDRILSGH